MAATPTVAQVIPPLYAGYLFNTVLPGKLGEVAKLILVSRRAKIPMVTATASVLIDRIVDGMGLGILMIGSLIGLGIAGWCWGVALMGMAFFTGVGVAVIVVTRVALIRRAVLNVAYRFNMRSAVTLIETGMGNLRVVQTPLRGGLLLLLSLFNWIAEAGLFVGVLHSLSVLGGFPSAIAMMGIVSFGSIVLSTPGGVGSHEFLVAKGAGVIGVAATTGLAIAVLTHLVLVIPTALGGGVAVLWMGWGSVRELMTHRFEN
jgi:uncharacterized membrane protein YbhN (UPF0104 family)